MLGIRYVPLNKSGPLYFNSITRKVIEGKTQKVGQYGLLKGTAIKGFKFKVFLLSHFILQRCCKNLSFKPVSNTTEISPIKTAQRSPTELKLSPTQQNSLQHRTYSGQHTRTQSNNVESIPAHPALLIRTLSNQYSSPKYRRIIFTTKQF